MTITPGGPYPGETVTWMDASGQSHTTVYDANGNPTTSSAADQSTVDGKQILQTLLNSFNLQGLDLNQAWQQYVNSGDNIDYVVNTWLPTTAAFKTAFPAWDTWSRQGHNVAQYVDYQNTIYAEAHAAGFPQGVVDKDTITNFINGGVSAGEAQQRILDAGKAVYSLDQNSKEYLQWREAGLSDGDLAAVWFDPNKALSVLENQLAAAQIGGAAKGAGVGLDTTLADQLAKQGVTASSARTGFDQIANDQQLFHNLPGQPGADMGQQQQVGAVFGTDASAQQALASARSGRLAPFKQGGNFSTSSKGVVGAGAATGV